MEQPLFLVIVSLLLIHEMDAIRKKEWRMFVVLKDMADEAAYKVFTLLHFPLFFCVLFSISSGGTAEYILKLIVDAFLLIHSVIHYTFRNHSGNGFTVTEL